MLSTSQRDSQRYKYKLIDSKMCSSSAQQKSIRNVLSAQSVIRIKEPYVTTAATNKLSPAPSQPNLSGLIRASTYNTHTASDVALVVPNSRKSAPSNRCSQAATAKLSIGLQSQPKIFTQSAKNMLRRFSAATPKHYENGTAVKARQSYNLDAVADSLEQALLKAKNPLTNEELKKFAYKSNVYEPHCEFFLV